MDWRVTPRYDDATHNPVGVFQRDATPDVIYRTARSGATMELSAGGSFGPDGDRLWFQWWRYREPGTYP